MLSNTSEDQSTWFPVYIEAIRLALKYAYDPMSVTAIGRIDPLPHQIEAFLDMVERTPLRILLADDVGLGKTIEVGLILKEFVLRNKLDNCLVVVPPILAPQWKTEIREKFGIEFEYLHRYFSKEDVMDTDFAIVNLDTLKSEKRLPWFSGRKWDMIIFDEAHKLNPGSMRYEAAELMAKQCENLLLLSATPHDGKIENFLGRLTLLDERMQGIDSDYELMEYLQTYMIRRIKRDVYDFNRKRLFPQRLEPNTVKIETEDIEKRYYDLAQDYVRNYYLNPQTLEKYRNIIFILLVVLRRLSSSIYSGIKTLFKRRIKIMLRLHEMDYDIEELEPIELKDLELVFDDDLERNDDELNEIADRVEGAIYNQNSLEDFDYVAYRDGADDEREKIEDAKIEFIDERIGESALKAELEAIDELLLLGRRMLEEQTDSKFQQLLQTIDNIKADRPEDKIIIFTEFRDTLNYIKHGLEQNGYKVTGIWGGLEVEEKEKKKREFEDITEILVGTEAAGEGINLQFANVVINYELPWNPNRLDQRIGRVYRYGQKKPIFIFNFSSVFPVEDRILDKLYTKLERIREALGDAVIDVLGNMISENQISEIIAKAFEDQEGAEQEIDALVEDKREMAEEISEKYLVSENINIQQFMDKQIRVMDRVTSYDIEKFTITTLSLLGIPVTPYLDDEEGEKEETKNAQFKSILSINDYEINTLILKENIDSYNLDSSDKQIIREFPPKMVITFDPSSSWSRDKEFIAIGHPLLDVLFKIVLNKNFSSLVLNINESQIEVLSPVIDAFVYEDGISNQSELPIGNFEFDHINYARLGLSRMRISEDGSISEEIISPLSIWDYSFQNIDNINEQEIQEIKELLNYHQNNSNRIEVSENGFLEDDQEIFTDILRHRKQKREHAIDASLGGEVEKANTRYSQLSSSNEYMKPILMNEITEAQQNYENAINTLEEESNPNNYMSGLIYSLNLGLVVPLTKSRIKTIRKRLKEIEDEVEWNPISDVVPNDMIDLVDLEESMNIRMKIDEAGMKAVMQYERDHGREPRDVSDRIVGFDVESVDEKTEFDEFGTELENETRYIEVKSFKTYGDVKITPNEWRVAKEQPDRYWLYIVLQAMDDDKRQIKEIPDPANNLGQFARVEPVEDYRIVIPRENWIDYYNEENNEEK